MTVSGVITVNVIHSPTYWKYVGQHISKALKAMQAGNAAVSKMIYFCNRESHIWYSSLRGIYLIERILNII